jgi:hypothetical protein
LQRRGPTQGAKISPLSEKLTSTAVAAAKLIPGVDSVVSFLEDLNKIWAGEDALLEVAHIVELDLLENLCRMNTGNPGRVARYADLHEWRKRCSHAIDIAKRALAACQLTESMRGHVSLLVGALVSFGIRNDELPSEFFVVARALGELDLQILIWLIEDDDPNKKRVLSLNTLSNRFPKYDVRELALSARKLSDMGLLSEQGPRLHRGTNALMPVQWTERQYLREANFEFGKRLRILPYIATMPTVGRPAPTIDQEDRAAKEMLDSFGEVSLNTLDSFWTSVRRHAFRGYQWKIVLRDREHLANRYVSRWTGDNWQYKTSAVAISAADEELSRRGVRSAWFYLDT